MNDQVTTEDSTETPEATSRWEDYIDIFFSPVELYRRRANDRIGPPLITLLLLAVVFYFILLPANSIIMRASLADNPEVANMMGSLGTIFQVIGGIFVPVTYLVVLGSAALLIWLIGRVLEIRSDFSRSMLITTYCPVTVTCSISQAVPWASRVR
ncbi:hypothetical protein BH23GEM9_BH23GEM9_06280 [soil metagenome]